MMLWLWAWWTKSPGKTFSVYREKRSSKFKYIQQHQSCNRLWENALPDRLQFWCIFLSLLIVASSFLLMCRLCATLVRFLPVGQATDSGLSFWFSWSDESFCSLQRRLPSLRAVQSCNLVWWSRSACALSLVTPIFSLMRSDDLISSGDRHVCT